MAECMETTYNPEAVEHVRKEQERRVVQEGTTMWKKRKEELQRQKHREQREVCFCTFSFFEISERVYFPSRTAAFYLCDVLLKENKFPWIFLLIKFEEKLVTLKVYSTCFITN